MHHVVQDNDEASILGGRRSDNIRVKGGATTPLERRKCHTFVKGTRCCVLIQDLSRVLRFGCVNGRQVRDEKRAM
jgi:hypothetical protein